MRFTKLAAAVGMAAAMVLGTAATSTAAEAPVQYKPIKSDAPKKKPGARAMTTTGTGTFMEINSDGELNRWVPNGSGSFFKQVRGSGWGATRQITSLDDDTFLEIKGDYRLSKWRWDGVMYHETNIGTAWQPARVISGVSSNNFVEVNSANELWLWTLNPNTNTLSRVLKGVGWTDTRLLAGLDGPPQNLDYLEIENSGNTSEWIDYGEGLQEFPFQGVNFSNVRIIAGLDLEHFVYVDNNNGNLVAYEYNWDQGAYVPRVAGIQWQPARLIG